MITPEIRDELRRIQAELKKPFPASLHEFRELPGGGKKWVFLKWQTIRERLDEVAPEWISDYSEIQYLGNDAICRCGITILGVRKEAIASVPISITSSSGKEMSRGSAADRLAAEAIKNAAEAWGVGRYLDDQAFTIRYLWERMSELNDAACGQVRLLSEQYKIQIKTAHVAPTKTIREPSSDSLKVIPVQTITEAQAKRLWAIARNEFHLSDEDVRRAIAKFGYDSTTAIAPNRYDAVIQEMRDLAHATF
ncbi:Rad52/Rad22 family DNA repair protein [Nostoc sp.]|uniref:Rad52/Rad22 family DNA repair protein n=1 Tax=Nostoc sp. TaxID=1180 RepID=UPI002FEF256B